MVGAHHVAGRPALDRAAVVEQHRLVAEPLDRGRVVRDEDDRPAAALEVGDLAEALLLERLVADREHLVQQQHVGLDVHRDREAEPHVHPRRVRPHRHVGERLELREGDDLLQVPVDVVALEAVDRRVQVDVLDPGELGVEAGADLDQRADAARRPRACRSRARRSPRAASAASTCPSRSARRSRTPGRARCRGRRRAAPTARACAAARGASSAAFSERFCERRIVNTRPSPRARISPVATAAAASSQSSIATRSSKRCITQSPSSATSGPTRKM